MFIIFDTEARSLSDPEMGYNNFTDCDSLYFNINFKCNVLKSYLYVS